MAFSIPCRPNILQILNELNKDDSKHRHLPNLTRKMTIGLNSTFLEIRATRSFSNISIKSNTTFPTNGMGHLLVGNSVPVLLKRYRLADLIAHGTFSQIFRAFDLFHLQHVAVKVMRIGYNALGVKEFEFLQFMATKTLRGSQTCKSRLYLPGTQFRMIFTPIAIILTFCNRCEVSGCFHVRGPLLHCAGAVWIHIAELCFCSIGSGRIIWCKVSTCDWSTFRC